MQKVKQLEFEKHSLETAKKNHSKTKTPAIFARHETFHPRYGWFKKGYDAVLEHSDIFSREDATIILGVGKNMVKAIKYWGLAFKVFKELNMPRKKIGHYEVTNFGHKLFDNDKGWDPYLEDPASLWLLHWKLFEPICEATAWWFTFNAFHRISFTQEDLLAALKKYKETLPKGASIQDSSLIKDVNCLLRMYAIDSSTEKLKKESIDCPFAELALLENDGDYKHFSFNLKKYGLPPEIIVNACLEYAFQTKQSASTISVSRLLHEPNSPGLIFKLTEASLCNAIEDVSQNFDEIKLSEAGGLLQFSFTNNPRKIADRIITSYYQYKK